MQAKLRADSAERSQVEIEKVKDGAAKRLEDRDDLKVARAEVVHWQELYYTEKLEKQKELAKYEHQLFKQELEISRLKERLSKYEPKPSE